MTTTIHTIKIQGNRRVHGTVSATRTSTSRRYVACLVATVTKRSVEIAAAAKVKLDAELIAARAAYESAARVWGLDIDAAKAEHETLCSAWFAANHAANSEIFKARGYTADLHARAERMVLAEGKVAYPFDMMTRYALVHTHRALEIATSASAMHQMPVIGQQGVVSWHASVPLASKALGGRDAKWRASQGDSVAVRTDIEIRERGVKKAS